MILAAVCKAAPATAAIAAAVIAAAAYLAAGLAAAVAADPSPVISLSLSCLQQNVLQLDAWPTGFGLARE